MPSKARSILTGSRLQRMLRPFANDGTFVPSIESGTDIPRSVRERAFLRGKMIGNTSANPNLQNRNLALGSFAGGAMSDSHYLTRIAGCN